MAMATRFMGLTYWAGIGLQDGVMAHWFFQFVFAATAATIVSGAVAERCNFFAYLIYSGIISGFTYPIVAHWVWSPQGWLLKMGYKDFAGCGAVHLMAGACSLVATVFLGPRIGRFDSKSGEKGDTDDFAGHSLPLVGIGGLLLMTGFLAFNGGSLGTMVGAGDSGLIARVICNTVMGGSGGGLLILAACKLGMFGPPAWSFAFTLNAALIGMVSVTAGVNEMSLWTSFISGLFGGPVYVALHYLVLKLKVDDPLDAVAVHLGGGIWGLLAASIFSNNGLIFGDIYRASMLLANRLIGALAIFTWTVATCSIMFGILKALNLMRVTAEQELQGLDASLHREIGYPRSAWEPNFQIPETKLSPISSNTGPVWTSVLSHRLPWLRSLLSLSPSLSGRNGGFETLSWDHPYIYTVIDSPQFLVLNQRVQESPVRVVDRRVQCVYLRVQCVDRRVQCVDRRVQCVDLRVQCVYLRVQCVWTSVCVSRVNTVYRVQDKC
uniref:Ammonium transporter AmtB-like domain-containing protein n=1 Tax=Timema cristinae TaxID=61476 RepID=A0A7R9CH35_TIMCR|nr:unnamed protein product [Timema cristinae]